MLEFFKKIIEYFNLHQVPYMLSGSIAIGLYVVPRTTRDIDFVVNLQPDHVDGFVKNFEGEYYCSEIAVKDAISHHSLFNVIDHAPGYKANFVILKNQEHRLAEFEHRKKVSFFGVDLFVASGPWPAADVDDTPEHIKRKQLEIWLAKPPEERIRLTCR